MVAIFVPRDEDELDKYKAAVGFNEEFHDALKWHSSNEGPSDGMQANDDVIRQMFQATKASYDIEYFVHNEGKDTTIVIIKEMPRKKAMVEAFTDQFSADDAKMYIDIFLGVAKAVVGQDVQAKDVVAFIHWGGGLPKKMEDGFRKNCEEYGCPELRVFSLSTRRRDKFNVNGMRIDVPKTLKEVNALVNKFMFDRVNDFLTEYVVKGTMSFKYPNDKSLVTNFLSWVREQYKSSMAFEKDERKIWKEVLDRVIDDPCPVDCKIDFSNKIVHVYSRIIEEGMENG